MQPQVLNEFKGQPGGELIDAADPPFDEARKVYNAMISRKPRLIVRCAAQLLPRESEYPAHVVAVTANDKTSLKKGVA